MEKFQLLSKVLTYASKPDKTNTLPELLVSGSQNVLIDDRNIVRTREGYTIYGAAGSGSTPVESEYDWQTSLNTVLNLRSYDDELEVYVGTVESIVFDSWEKVADGWTAVDFSFAPWWSSLEVMDLLFFVNGADQIQEWSGGLTTYASATSNTITKQGTDTWAAKRFLTNGTTKIRIKDTGGTWREFTYTGGEATTTLTGVTPDPTGYTFAAGALVMQSVRTNDNEPADAAVNDFIWVEKNQVWIGSNTRNHIYVSKDTDFTDYSFSTPRVPGEGALLVLNNVGRGFLPLQGRMLITGGRDDWYHTEFAQLEIGTTLTETLKVIKLETGPGMAAQSQDLISGLLYIGFDKILHRIIGISDNNKLETEDLSDPIKPDFDAVDFTNGHIKIHRNRTYITCPNDSTMFISEVRRNENGTFTRFWQPPQILPIRRFAIISDLIYGHSSGFNETYRLFNGTNDNENPIAFNATYSYRNYGNKEALKVFDKWITEGYIRGNTKIIQQLRYDFQGATQTLEKEIDGSDSSILFELITGMTPLGSTPLGLLEESTQQPKFRQISDFIPQDFFEIQVVYYSSAVDDQWWIISQGGNIRISPNKPTFLSK